MRSALELLGAAYAVHPAFGEARIVEFGSGLRPAYPDNLPRIAVHNQKIAVNGLYRHGFLLAPVERTAMYVAKVLTLLSYLVVLEIVAVPAFALLLLGTSLGPALPSLVVSLVLGDIGVAVIGTLVAALAVRTRARDLLGPLLSLPLLVPIVIGGARATSPALVITHVQGPQVRWLLTLGLYDLVFGLIAYALFDFLLED